MAKTILQGYLVAAGASSETLHSHAGRILGVLVGNPSASADSVTFYNDTAATGGKELLVIDMAAYESTCFLMFDRNNAIPFDTGLHVDPSNSNVHVWSIDYG